MLNSIKKINYNTSDKKTLIMWKVPFPTKFRFQTRMNPDLTFLSGLPVILAARKKKKIRWWKKSKKRRPLPSLKINYFFNSVSFNFIFLFKKFFRFKKRRFELFKFKKQLLFLNHLFKEKKIFKGFPLKKNKGGLFASILGFRSFMPKSHSNRLLTLKVPVTRLIGLKIYQRRKRFSVRKKIKLNIISSSKPQQGGKKSKKAFNIKTGKSFYWRKIQQLVNKRKQLDKEVISF